MDADDKRRYEVNWRLRRRQARLQTEFDFLSRECVQLCQKRFLKPPIESIELTEGEEKFLNELKERKMKEVVTKQCLSAIKFLMSQKFLSYPFNEPVDTVTYRDYLNYVRTPMDFGTIKGKILQYKTAAGFEADVRLVFENAKKYNAPETEVREMARILEMRFDEKWTKTILPRIEELKRSEMEDRIAFKQSKAENFTMEAETRVDECCRLLLNKLQILTEEIKYVQCLAAAQCKPLTEPEQLRLGWELTTLPPEQFQHAVNLVLMRHPGLIATMRDNTIEFDLNKMDCLTLRQLQDFVRYCEKEKKKAEECGDPFHPSPAKKRPRQSASPLGYSEGRSADFWSLVNRGVQWPTFTAGIGLKPYDAEVEAFVPPNTEETSSLPYAGLSLNNYSCPSTEFGTPSGSSPVHIHAEDAPQEQPFVTSMSMQPSPFFTTPGFKIEGAGTPPPKEEIVLSSGLLLPSAFSVLAMSNPPRIDPIRPLESLPEDVQPPIESGQSSMNISELTPPTVKVSSAGLDAIPLVPDSHSANIYPSFFMSNIQPRGLVAPAVTSAPILQGVPQSSPDPAMYVVVSSLPPESGPSVCASQPEPVTSSPQVP